MGHRIGVGDNHPLDDGPPKERSDAESNSTPIGVTVNEEGEVEEFEGPEGPEGPEGEEGPEGPEGPEGGEGKQGKEGPEGKQGKEGPEGKPAPTGTFEIFNLEWAADGTTTLISEITPSFVPVIAIVCGVAMGTKNEAPITGGRLCGVNLGAAGSQSGGEKPAYFTALIGSGAALGYSPGPKMLRLERGAAMAAACKYKIAVCFLSVPNLMTEGSSSSGFSETNSGGNGIVGSKELTTIRNSCIFVASYGRKLEEVPTKQDGISILPPTKAEYGVGVFGTAGVQFHFVTEAEKKALKTDLTWTFPVFRSATSTTLRTITSRYDL